jgi:hypothetical protein
MSYYIIQNDETKGPYTLGQLRSMWSAGSITSKTMHCQEGDSRWRQLSVIERELETPAAVPPPAAQPAGFRVKKVEFAGVGAIVQIIGLILCITIVGAIIGIPLFIIGRSMDTKFLCSQCGNKLSDKETAICPVCRCQFRV